MKSNIIEINYLDSNGFIKSFTVGTEKDVKQITSIRLNYKKHKVGSID